MHVYGYPSIEFLSIDATGRYEGLCSRDGASQLMQAVGERAPHAPKAERLIVQAAEPVPRARFCPCGCGHTLPRYGKKCAAARRATRVAQHQRWEARRKAKEAGA